jgi:hypothetical protein
VRDGKVIAGLLCIGILTFAFLAWRRASDEADRSAPSDLSARSDQDAVTMMWSEYLDYGPHLADILSRSGQLDAAVAAEVARSGAPNRVELTRLVDRAAETQASLQHELDDITVPPEASRLKRATHQLLIGREGAMRHRLTALNNPSPDSEAAARIAKEDADHFWLTQTLAELQALCRRMNSPLEQCLPAGGFPPP